MPDTDRNYLSIADRDGVTLEYMTITPEHEGEDVYAYDDILKLSKATNFVGRKLKIIGGSENAIDMNRYCADVLIDDVHLIGGMQCGMVIKGGCRNITLRDVIFYDPEATGYDLEIGGWSDQSQAPTTDVTLDHVIRADGHSPVRVVVGNATKPRIIGGNVKILFWRSLALKAFILVRRLLG